MFVPDFYCFLIIFAYVFTLFLLSSIILHLVLLHTIIENVGLQFCWLSLQRHLWINTQSEETASIVPEALSLLMMKVKLKIPPNHVFFYLNNLMKTTHEDNYFYKSIWSRHCFLWGKGKVYFPCGGHKLGWIGDVVHLHWNICKPFVLSGVAP